MQFLFFYVINSHRLGGSKSFAEFLSVRRIPTSTPQVEKGEENFHTSLGWNIITGIPFLPAGERSRREGGRVREGRREREGEKGERRREREREI